MKRLLASSIAAVVLLTACGVAEDTTAATVDGRDITVSAVTKLAKSEYLVSTASGEGLVSSSDVVVGSTTRRAALALLVQAEVFAADVRAQGGEVTDEDRQAADAQISQYEQEQGVTIDEAARPTITRLLAARTASARLSPVAVDEVTDAQVEAYFADNAEQFADLSCVDAFAVEPAQAAAAQAAVDGGDSLAEILSNAQLAAQPLGQDGGEVCAPPDQVQEPTLAQLIYEAPVGQWASGEIANGGETIAVFVRPNSRGDVGPDNETVAAQVRQQLQAEAETAAQTLSSDAEQKLFELADVEIDPRYGDWDPSQQSLILAPPAPRQSAKAAADVGLTAEDLAGLQGQ